LVNGALTIHDLALITKRKGLDMPEGAFIAHGIAIPVLMAVAAGIVMPFISTRTRFGRYVFAIGRNPEAAELAGVIPAPV
jgi:D-xylose transport system permease protein